MILKNNYNIITLCTNTRLDKMSGKPGLPPFNDWWAKKHNGFSNSNPPNPPNPPNNQLRFVNCKYCGSLFASLGEDKIPICGKTCDSNNKLDIEEEEIDVLEFLELLMLEKLERNSFD